MCLCMPPTCTSQGGRAPGEGQKPGKSSVAAGQLMLVDFVGSLGWNLVSKNAQQNLPSGSQSPRDFKEPSVV